MKENGARPPKVTDEVQIVCLHRKEKDVSDVDCCVQSWGSKGPSIWKALSLDARCAFRSQFKAHIPV